MSSYDLYISAIKEVFFYEGKKGKVKGKRGKRERERKRGKGKGREGKREGKRKGGKGEDGREKRKR